MRKLFDRLNIKAIHAGRKITYVRSYDGKLPSEIYEQYMAGWGEVNLVPGNLKLEKLITHLQKVKEL